MLIRCPVCKGKKGEEWTIFTPSPVVKFVNCTFCKGKGKVKILDALKKKKIMKL